MRDMFKRLRTTELEIETLKNEIIHLEKLCANLAIDNQAEESRLDRMENEFSQMICENKKNCDCNRKEIEKVEEVVHVEK